jgi:hypothetical protein
MPLKEGVDGVAELGVSSPLSNSVVSVEVRLVEERVRAIVRFPIDF